MSDIISISVFYEFAALLVLAAGVGLVGLTLRQPLIVSFIAVGILAGPSALHIARSSEHIELFAELGVAVLLFLVGLKLDLKLIRTLGPVALTTGLGQVVFTSVIGFLICLGLALDALTSLYVAVALTFSSTIIIVKLLSDKKEIDSLHGQIALGFLIVQDLVVVLAMVVLSALGIGVATDAPLLEVAMTLVSGLALLAVVGVFIRYLAEPLVRRVARAPELLICFVIGWAALLAALGDYLGLGKELGGLLAGVSLASTQFRESIATRMAPLRDFLVLFFFIGLGARLDLGLLNQELTAAALLSLFVLIGNPLIVLIIMGLMGYRKRTGFLAGLTVAQISEFSLIFMAMGLSIGHVDEQALGLVTLVGLITIGLSVYMITYSHRLYDWLEPLLGRFERKVPHREDREAQVGKWQKFDVLLFGLGRYGTGIARRLRQHGLKVLGIDFNPEVIRSWDEPDIEVIYGDATDPEFIGSLPLGGAKWTVSAVPEHRTGLTHDDPRIALIQALRFHGFTGRIAVAAQRSVDVDRLRAAGADVVLLPFQDAADQAVALLLGGEPRERVLIEAEVKEEQVA
jgi:Kef-type K+ transport system membrane component KefB/Trk K+ transport system NAD-binding subunit